MIVNAVALEIFGVDIMLYAYFARWLITNSLKNYVRSGDVVMIIRLVSFYRLQVLA